MPTGSERRSTRRSTRGLRVAAVAVLLVLMSATGCAGGGSATPQNAGPAGAVTLGAAVVPTADGPVRGVVKADHRLFQGIPYAAPPVGPLRWALPQPAAPWPGVRDALEPGRWCVQPLSDGSDGPDTDGLTGEDCLTLNVWTPLGAASAGRPVLVWIHGGGFVKGSGDIYDAHRLVTRGDIVVVTINYRLGALGFLAHPALGAAGNYGLADQQAALRWVRDNIANFGGDPAKVTIAGESAGGMSVCEHLVSPDSAGLFRAAVIQSGPCLAHVDLVTARQISRDYAAALGCEHHATPATCLRALPAAALAEPLWYARFGTDRLSGPVTGTHSLPANPARMLSDGKAAPVPVLVGINRDEFTLFVALRYLREGRELGPAEYPGVLADTFGAGDGATVLGRYPPHRYGGSVSLAYAAAATDDIFACVADRMAAGQARNGPAVYGYQFDDPDAPAPEMYQQVPFPIGASHSLEVRYLFDIGGSPPLDPRQRVLSDQMIDYWVAFVATGAPKAAGQPDWPPVGTDSTDAPWMSLRADGSRVVTDFGTDHQCPFWAALRR